MLFNTWATIPPSGVRNDMTRKPCAPARGLHANCARTHELAEVRKVVVGAGIGDFVRGFVDDHDRMLDVRVGIAMNRRYRPRAAGFVEDGVPVEPRGRARLQITENNVAPPVAVGEFPDRQLLCLG